MMNKIRGIVCGSLVIFVCVVGVTLGQQRKSTAQSKKIPSLSPARKAARNNKWYLDQAAIEALKAGDYVDEEADARQSLSLGVGSGLCQDLLAQALYSQNEDQEALKVYKAIADQGGDQLRNLVPYASLLLKAGQWSQAVTIYNKALLGIGNPEMIIANSHFSPDIPQPKELAAALHLAQGLTNIDDPGWVGHPRNEDAMGEFSQALKLAPEAPLTNYYYGYGWQHLDLKSKTRKADALQAKVALRKAAQSEEPEVREAAGAALKGMN